MFVLIIVKVFILLLKSISRYDELRTLIFYSIIIIYFFKFISFLFIPFFIIMESQSLKLKTGFRMPFCVHVNSTIYIQDNLCLPV